MISIIGEFRGEKNIFKTCKVLAIPTGPLLEHCCFLVAESWPTLCHLMDCSTPGFPVLHYLPEFVQTHVHWVGDAIQLSHPLSPPLLLPSIFPRIRGFSNELVLPIRWPKYWSFSFSISRSNEYSGLISFRIDWFDLLQSQESSPAPQFKSINSFSSQLSL